jgi:hypothetical protein
MPDALKIATEIENRGSRGTNKKFTSLKFPRLYPLVLLLKEACRVRLWDVECWQYATMGVCADGSIVTKCWYNPGTAA